MVITQYTLNIADFIRTSVCARRVVIDDKDFREWCISQANTILDKHRDANGYADTWSVAREVFDLYFTDDEVFNDQVFLIQLFFYNQLFFKG